MEHCYLENTNKNVTLNVLLTVTSKVLKPETKFL